ncbi:hypothetical protein [Cytobacillus purgationiresistens]|uniref:Uncharacterized protein n=1 Tax=Cytobacillus purgationiresistens TaxID=863449 RepID=A0ABU0AR04_9BACI|nr:hypothetical protein [Cytobacillus purgationiresistens]MDQ0273304.1 hypothetical protein [Cytobacillus purgationiresistens]
MGKAEWREKNQIYSPLTRKIIESRAEKLPYSPLILGTIEWREKNQDYSPLTRKITEYKA